MDDTLEKYCRDASTPEPALLAALARETCLRTLNPRMAAGWQQGMLLRQLAALAAPRRMLEVGTFTGYSALCLAAALPPDGLLHTYDVDDEALAIAKEFIAQSPLATRIRVHHQSALEGAPQLGEEFGFVFIDGDKREYPDYYRMALPLVPAGGLIVADNVLWGGKVLRPAASGDRHTRALQEFNALVCADDRVEKLVLPLRDGLTIIRKR
ncbi:MAG: class I SAM-dependent methyltransferase, partial [Prevotellaceae bacterium]|nr:class I SAM-dependent methyltransferase [Prevotellaceae bacterium]